MSTTVMGPADRNKPPVSASAPDADQAPQLLGGKLALLRRLQLFADVADAELIPLASRAYWQTYAAGEIVMDVGDTTNDVFVIAEGAVRIVVRTAFGYEAILNDLGPLDIFGELAAIDGAPRSANATTLLQSRLCVLSGNAFMDLALSAREVGHRLLRFETTRLRGKDERLIEFSVLSVRQRLIAELLRLSRDRGGGERVVTPPPPQHVLAARVGTRRESVSREMAEMVRSELITVARGAIILHRPEVLRAEVDARLQGHEPRTVAGSGKTDRKYQKNLDQTRKS
jgi:CRP/FNR family cyclic AMP-dependent transcriptional regulator